jgi:hypothetical protein
MSENDKVPSGDEQPDQPTGAGPSEGAGADSAERRGQMRFQDAETATPREPTLAEKRARMMAEKRREEEETARIAAATRKTEMRRKMMIGGGVTVGVVALVAAFYSAVEYSNQANAMQASCTAVNPATNEPLVQPDEYCDQEYARTHGGHYDSHSGLWLMPLFLGGGHFGPPAQYRYSYSPSGTAVGAPGQKLSSPTNYTKPGAGTRVTTKSGTTVQRGGFGIGNKGGSGT